MKLKIPQYQLSEVLNMMAFKGISEADIKTMMDLGILREHYYRYNSTIFKAGEITEELGIVIKGRVIVENVDYWGSKSILSSALPGKVFGETYALSGHKLMIDARATEPTIVFLLNAQDIMSGKYNSYGEIRNESKDTAVPYGA